MFEQMTTIVLGAGASAHLGFPLGARILWKARSELEQFFKARRSSHSAYPLQQVRARNAETFSKDGCSALIAYLVSPEGKSFLPAGLQLGEAVRTFYDDLVEQDPASIDRFIYDNPRHAFFGKALLAQYVLMNLYEVRDDGIGYRKDFSVGKNNWYRELAKLMRENAATGDDIKKNNLYLVTFNYDTSLELALSKLLPQTERHRDADPALNIFHVNGAPTDVPERIVDAGAFVMKAASDLHLFRDDASEAVLEARAKARSAIAN